MKWRAELNTKKYSEIEEDNQVGFYLYIFEDGVCLIDRLQDTLELAIECAWEDYGIPPQSWKKVEE